MKNLISNISVYFDEIVKSKKNINPIFLEESFFNMEHEKRIETQAYKTFVKEYKKLYNEKYYVYRIDKIMELFYSYLYVDGKICIRSDLYIYDYIKIAEEYFSFLKKNYYAKLYTMDERKSNEISIETFNKKIDYLFLTTVSCNDINDEFDFGDNYDAYMELYQMMVTFWNPFDKKMIRELLQLYYIIKDSVKQKKEIEAFILFKLMEYDVVDDSFEFLIHAPYLLNSWFIKNIYDTKSARLVYNLLQDMVIKFKFYGNKINFYFNQIIKLIKNAKDERIKKIYNEFSQYNMENIEDLENKIEVFRNLEEQLFKKLKIFGIYGSYYSFIFEDYNKEELDDPFDNFYYESGNESNTYNHLINYQEDYYIENRLRLIYQEMKGFFENISLDLNCYINLKEQFGLTNDLEKLLIKSKELYDEYELNDLSNLFENNIVKENYNYNSDSAKEHLIDDFENLNIISASEKVEELMKYSKVKKTLLSATNWWSIFEKTQDMNIEKDGQDYTPIIANYFKAVELLIYSKIRKIFKEYEENSIELLPIYKVNGVKVNILENNEITLGEMVKYIKREKRIVKENFDNLVIADKIKYWSENIRNSHFHKHIIAKKSELYKLKEESLLLIDDIIYYFR